MEWTIDNIVQLMYNLGGEWGILIINLIIMSVLIMVASVIVKSIENKSN